MSQKKITDLPAASELEGTELYESSQSGVSVKVTGDAVRSGKVKVYRALLTQTGTNDPVPTVLENTLGGSPALSRTGVGAYLITLSGAFPTAKTFCGNFPTSVMFQVFYPIEDGNSIGINTFDSSGTVAVDGYLYITPIEILVYP